jgi:hypothetical protein
LSSKKLPPPLKPTAASPELAVLLERKFNEKYPHLAFSEQESENGMSTRPKQEFVRVTSKDGKISAYLPIEKKADGSSMISEEGRKGFSSLERIMSGAQSDTPKD